LNRRARLLRAAVGATGPLEPTQVDWSQWAELAKTERVIPLLHRIVTTSTTNLSLAQLEGTTAMQLDVMATMVQFEHDLLKVASTLADTNCRYAVVKGAATCHLDYDDASLRQFGDLDVLVAPADFVRAHSALSDQGWVQAYSLPRHHDRFTHAITLRKSGRVEVDLHQHIAHRALGLLIPTEDLLADTVEFHVAGQVLQALRDEDRLIHSSIHALASRAPYNRLSGTADVLVLAEAQSEAASSILDRAGSWGVRSLVLRSIELAYQAAQLPVPPNWLAQTRNERTGRASLVEAAYLAERRRPVLEELAYLRIMPGWSDRIAYTLGYFATDPDYARHRQRSGLRAQTRYLLSRLTSR
jgi:hypothetical protein